MSDDLPVDDHRPAFASRVEPRLVVAVGAVVVAVAVATAWWRRSTTTPQLPPPAAAVAGGATTRSTRAAIVVQVAGAVVHPGVVTVPSGARVIDAIDAVGGATRDADVDQLDLAAKLVDGARVYVPRHGERAPPVAAGDGAVASDPGAAAGPIDLNTATEAQLETLPGVGPSLAQAIIAERERRGGFARVSDLASVRGIGPRRLAQLTPLVTV